MTEYELIDLSTAYADTAVFIDHILQLKGAAVLIVDLGLSLLGVE